MNCGDPIKDIWIQKHRNDNNQQPQEIFGAGTAAVISPVSAFSYQDIIYELEKQEDGFAARFKKDLMDIQYNRAEDPFDWRFEVK